MKLGTDGRSLSIRRGSVTLRADQVVWRERVSSLVLEIVRHDPVDVLEIKLNLDPWFADAYEVHDWEVADAIVLSGAGQVVAVSLHAPHRVAAMGLEYEEAETIDSPWFVEVGSDALVVATERRAWCIDASPSIRWCWNARTGPDDRWVCGAPRVESEAVLVPIRSRGGELLARLNIRDGSLE